MRWRLFLCVCGVPLWAPAEEFREGTTAPEKQAVERGELLRIALIRAPAPPAAAAADAPAPAVVADEAPSAGSLFVRVGADGFARFPVTERRLPFAGLELPVIEAMLGAHLALHEQVVERVEVTRHRPANGLVTVLGQVARPGVYSLPADATLEDAITAAGGVVGGAEPTPVPAEPNAGVSAAGLSRSRLTPGTVSQPPQTPRNATDFRVRMEHPTLTLSALVDKRHDVVIQSRDFARTRLCIDGVILNVEAVSVAVPPASPSDDLFRPL